MRVRLRIPGAAIAVLVVVAGGHTTAAGRQAPAQSAAPTASSPKPLTRASAEEIKKNVDRQWIHDQAINNMLDPWIRHSVEPSGFIQENLDRKWQPWGDQREASINGQGRQLFSMARGYEMTQSKEYRDALQRGMAFLLKMRDPKFGGYYDRVSPTLEVINDNKTGYMSFALYSLAEAGRVTGDKEYLDAAMTLFRVVRDKMRDGPFIGGGSYVRDFSARAPGGLFGGGRATPPGASGTGAANRGGAAAPTGRVAPAAGGAASAFANRRHGINLHMFEALLGLYDATRSPEVWKEIDAELAAIERLFDDKLGYLPESYDDDWKPVGNPSGNPGHLFEWASLLSRAVELGADPKFIALGSRNLDLGLKSYDMEVGGLNPRNAAGEPTRMLWWPQCEVIKATATYAILHGRSELWPYYHKTVDLITNHYLDTEDGGWFADYVVGQPREERGERAFYKGSVDGPEWGAYHPVSMLSEVWRISDPKYTVPTRSR